MYQVMADGDAQSQPEAGDEKARCSKCHTDLSENKFGVKNNGHRYKTCTPCRTAEQERRRRRAARNEDIERDPELEPEPAVQQDDEDRSVNDPLENMAS
jgi:hypothetical protein